jgi:hypothetical protein
MSKNQFWCETCQKKYWLENPQYNHDRIIQDKVAFIDHEINKRTKESFVKFQGKVKCKTCGFLLQEIKKDEH